MFHVSFRIITEDVTSWNFIKKKHVDFHRDVKFNINVSIEHKISCAVKFEVTLGMVS